MLNELLNNKKFSSEISRFYSENQSEILDIILFGSTARGAEKPNDIDLLIIFKNEENVDVVYALRKRLENLQLAVTVVSKNYTSLMDTTFRAKESILSEGYSLLKRESLAHGFGYVNFIAFRYALKNLNNSERTRFHYALQGRYGRRGVLKELSLIKFSDSVLLSPVPNAEQTKNFLELWKLDFTRFPVLLPLRMEKILAT